MYCVLRLCLCGCIALVVRICTAYTPVVFGPSCAALSVVVPPAAERYAHLTASMLLLHADFSDGPLDTNIDRLRYAGACQEHGHHCLGL